MFKNVMVYRLGAESLPSLDEMETALAQARFVECGASQEMSLGWPAPRGEQHGTPGGSIAGQRPRVGARRGARLAFVPDGAWPLASHGDRVHGHGRPL